MKQMYDIVDQDYKKITDILLWLDDKYYVSFTTEFYRTLRDKDPVYFHSEIGYQSNGKYSVNIVRKLYYYLTIESKERASNGIKNNIRIDQSNSYQFSIALNAVSQWLIDQAYSNLFVMAQNNIIKLGMDVAPIKVNGVFDNTVIEFAPAVHISKITNNQDTGIAIYINNSPEPIFISSSKFMNFKYFMDGFNMYQTALSMINYLGRPDNGTNYIDYSGFDQTKELKRIKPKGFFEEMRAKKREEK